MLAKLKSDVARLREMENELVRVGISPHSPYTMSEKLLVGMTGYARDEKLPLMIHAAESEHEDELLKHGRGTFAEHYAERGIEWPSPRMSPIQYLSTRGVLAARPLLAHCVRVGAADIETIREARASVAHCPKSNLKLGHGHAPFAAMSGLTCGFGSDSVASNNTCDMLEEARFAVLLARLDRSESDGDSYNAQDALTDATHGGARALGYGEQTGTLAEGREADLAIFKLDGAHQVPVYDPARALIFSTSARDAVLTMVAGREVYRAGERGTNVDEERLRARMTEIKEKVTSDE
jgi:5-methylthioadenosine/S-adenosylhomocysteine deaminase